MAETKQIEHMTTDEVIAAARRGQPAGARSGVREKSGIATGAQR